VGRGIRVRGIQGEARRAGEFSRYCEEERREEYGVKYGNGKWRWNGGAGGAGEKAEEEI
jgi:hypothetical protein